MEPCAYLNSDNLCIHNESIHKLKKCKRDSQYYCILFVDKKHITDIAFNQNNTIPRYYNESPP